MDNARGGKNYFFAVSKYWLILYTIGETGNILPYYLVQETTKPILEYLPKTW